MSEDDVTAAYSPANDCEREALERRWYAGELWRHYAQLLEFLARHRHEFQPSASAPPDADTVVAGVKRLIVHTGSIHHSAEMHDQIEAIRKEIWIRGEQGNHDRETIARLWAECHAESFRRWRLKEYVYVVDRCAPEIVAHLVSQGAVPGVATQARWEPHSGTPAPSTR